MSGGRQYTVEDTAEGEETKMAKSKVIAEGTPWRLQTEWGEFAVPSGTEQDYESTYEKLRDLVVERFEQIAQEHGAMLAWIRETGQVVGPQDPAPELLANLETWRAQAEREVTESWNRGEIAAVYSGGAPAEAE